MIRTLVRWYDQYYARIEMQRVKAFERINAFIAEEAPKHRGAPFVCVCGEECDPLGDPDFGRVHGPHIHDAAAARRREK